METSILIAKIASIIYLSISLGIFFNGDYYKKEISKILDNPGVMYVGGLMALIIGFLIIHVHNLWVKNWTVLVTLLGWIALLKGVMILTFPKSLEWFKPILKNKNLRQWAFIPLALGLLFGYFGFLI